MCKIYFDILCGAYQILDILLLDQYWPLVSSCVDAGLRDSQAVGRRQHRIESPVGTHATLLLLFGLDHDAVHDVYC